MEKLGVLSVLCGKKLCGGDQQHFIGRLPASRTDRKEERLTSV